MQDPHLLARCADAYFLVLSSDDSEARPVDIKAIRRNTDLIVV
jgi:hypothetical protein